MIKYTYKLNLNNDESISIPSELKNFINPKNELIISNNENAFEIFKKYIEENGISVGYTVSSTYNSELLKNVKYYSIRANKNIGYPVPQDRYLLENFNLEENICTCGAEQVKPIHISKPVHWKKKRFFAPFWLYDMLFTTKEVKIAFEESNLNGIRFENVYIGKSSKKMLDDVFQLQILEKLPNTTQTLYSNVSQISVCCKCKKEIVTPSLDSEYLLDYMSLVDLQGDIFYSNDIFGKRKIIVTQKAKDFLVRNNFTNGIEIKPVFNLDQKELISSVTNLDAKKIFISSFTNEDDFTKKLIINDENEKIIYPILDNLI